MYIYIIFMFIYMDICIRDTYISASPYRGTGGRYGALPKIAVGAVESNSGALLLVQSRQNVVDELREWHICPSPTVACIGLPPHKKKQARTYFEGACFC